MNEYQKNIESLNKMFDKLNVKYFGGTLEHPTITIQNDVKAYGHFTCKKVWTDTQNNTTHEINISPNFKRSKYEVVGTLLHEMVHAYATANNIKDTSRQGRYHNKEFRKLAEERGLIIEYADVIGWSVTRPTDKLCEFIDETRIKFCDCYRAGEAKEPKDPKPRAKKYKYKCPTCGLEIETTTENAQVMCITCNQILTGS